MSCSWDFRDFVQVAGVIDRDEARLLVSCGVRFLGFPLRLPVNREDLSEADAAAIIRAIPPPCYGVAITYQSDADEVVGLTDALGARLVQLHGDIGRDELARIRRLRPGLAVIKSLVVGKRTEEDLVATALHLAPLVDAFITDTFDPGTGASGATGKAHDWGVSRRLVAISPKPVILAGGLHPGNVREAIVAVGPAGVDAHTGLEGADGRKDPARVRRFVEEARRGFVQVRARLGRAPDASRP